MVKKFLMFALACLFVGVSAIAQTKTITGKVVGSDDPNGVPGAGIMVKGTTKGTAADIDGNYNLSASKGQTLVFSAIGYATQEIVVGDANVINVSLKTDAKTLEGAVVVGYGSQKKENLTGAVASIDVNKTLDSRPIADVGRGLQGATPGLNVTIPTGEVGSDPIMKIRGAVASLNGSSTPLILYDGVEIPSISVINPNDVESISILKDAASAAIYGAKAAFGVVLITSKKGSHTEGVTVTYTGNFSWQNTAYDINMAKVDGLRYTVDAFDRVGGSIAGAFWYVDKESLKRSIQWQEKYGGTIGSNDPVVYGRDWYVRPGSTSKMGLRTYDAYDYMIRENAPSTQHNISIGGKSGNTSYNLGLGYLMQNGMLKPAKHDDFEKYSASLSLTTKVNDWFTANAGFIYSKRNKRYPFATSSTTADPWYYMYRWGPLYPFGTDENGLPVRSPAEEFKQANTANIYNGYTSVNIGGLFTFTPNWTLSAQFTYSANNYEQFCPGTRFTAGNTWVAGVARKDASGNQVYVNDEWGLYGGDGTMTMPAYDLNYSTYTANGSNPDRIYREQGKSENTNTDIYTSYNLNIGEDHNFKFMVGLNRVTSKYKSNWSQKTHLLDIENPQFSLADGTQTSGGDETWQAQLGYFARLNYAYKDKYLLEGNVRYGGTSKFGLDYAWRWFYAGSAAWKFTEESFMEWTKPTLTSGKIRASYGIIGDQSVGNDLYLATMSNNSGYWLGSSGTKYPYYTTPALINGNITWQDIETIDLGIDLRFFNNKLGITFDWFQRTTKNMIVAGAGVPTTLGTGAPQGNYGDLRTRGWEIAVDFNHRFENGLGINATASLSDYTSKITKYAEGATKNLSNTWWEGNVYGDIYGYETDRLYSWDDFELIGDGSKKWANLQKVKLGATSVTAAEAAQGIIADPNAGRTYGQSAGKVVYMQKNHATAVYQGGLQSGSLYFGPGDVKYKDLNGDGDIYYGTNVLNHYDENGKFVDSQGDLSKIGNSTPRMEYGLRLGADWKGFDFSIFIQGIGKRKVSPSGNLGVAGFNSSDGAMPQAIAGDYWTWDEAAQTGRTNAYYPRAVNYGSSDPDRSSFNNTVQSKYLLNMAYCRIKNITLGYTIPESLTRKIFINKARFYVSLENFFTFDNLNNLPIDPEEISGYSLLNTSNYNSGRTGVGTPTFKSFSFGIELSF